MDDKQYRYCCTNIIVCVLVAVLILPQASPSGKKENVEHLMTLSDKNKSNEVRDLGCSSPKGTMLTLKRDGTMTAMLCVVKCWQSKYEYAVIQNGNRCKCSHSRNKPRRRRQCRIRCPGDRKQTCGGGRAASQLFTGYVKMDREKLHELYTAARLVYKRNKSKMTAEMAAYDNIGPCIKIVPGNFLSFTFHGMSKELCVVHCFHYKFTYALLSGGVKCTCLSRLPKKAKTYTVSREDCNMLCPGNNGQRCGGRDGETYNVWLTGHYNQTDHLSQKDYRPVNALVQGWKSYVWGHPHVRGYLTKLGISVPSAPPTAPPTGKTAGGTSPKSGNNSDVDVEDDLLIDPDSGAASGVLAGVVIAGLVAASAVLGLVLYLRRSKYSNPYGSQKDREQHKLLKKQISERPSKPSIQPRTRGVSGDESAKALAGDVDDEVEDGNVDHNKD